MEDMLRRARGIRLMIFDVDGVLTDGRLYYTDAGAEMKAFSTLDGHGIKMLMSSGVGTAIITGRRSEVVSHRAKNLGIQHVLQGIEDKRGGPAELSAYLNTELRRWGEIVKLSAPAK